MASTASPSLKLQLMATGDQSGTWGDTTNTNLGTLLEQAITGYQAIAKVGTTDYTLTNTDYVANENRNAIIEFTGTPGGAFNVIVPLAEKLWVFKNSTNGAMTVKGATGTGVTVAVNTSRWLYCDGTNVLDALTGTLATQLASSVAITGGTVTGLTSLTLASGSATPATNDAAALGTGALSWSDLFLASGGVINFANGDVTVTHSTDALAFAGAANGYTFANVVRPSANDAAALGTATVSWSDLFLATGAVVNFANGDVTITHATDTLAFAGAANGYTFSNAITPAANDGAALGSATVSWADLFLATGGVVNFANGNYTLTHSSGVLTASGAFSVGVSNAITTGTLEVGNATDTTISRVSAGLIAVEGKNVALEGNSVSFANVTATTAAIMGSGDGTGTVVGGTIRAPAKTGLDAAGVNLTVAAGNGTGTGGSGSLIFQTAPAAASSSTANTLTERMRITNTGTVQPGANDGGALGTGTLSWSDLFLASGGVVNFANGDVTVTHSTDALAFAGAANGYTFSNAVTPAANDGAALGSATVSWADLFLATGGVINWANGDITITGNSNALAFANASNGYSFDAAVLPSANDAAALGSASTSWADLFLATGGVINWASGDITITGNTNALAFAGASSGYSFDANVATTGTFTKNGNDITVGTITYVIDGGGAAITTGSKGYLEIPFNCTVNDWTIVADQSGSIVVDVKRATYANFPTTASIAGTEKPTLSSVQKNQDTSLSSWSTITAGDILEFVVDSATTVQRVTVALQVTRA